MQKILMILLTLALMCTPALAFEGNNYPVWDGAPPPADAACGSFGGQNLHLVFDPTADFSMAENGIAQLCFYAQDDDLSHYLELYLILPMHSVQAGDVITEKTMMAEPCSVTLYEVSQYSESSFFSGQFFGTAYPDGSSFELKIDSCETTTERFSLSGSLKAVLGELKGDFATGKTIALENISFNCSLPLSASAGAAAPEMNPFEATPEPIPKFTLPPDYIRL